MQSKKRRALIALSIVISGSVCIAVVIYANGCGTPAGGHIAETSRSTPEQRIREEERKKDDKGMSTDIEHGTQIASRDEVLRKNIALKESRSEEEDRLRRRVIHAFSQGGFSVDKRQSVESILNDKWEKKGIKYLADTVVCDDCSMGIGEASAEPLLGLMIYVGKEYDAEIGEAVRDGIERIFSRCLAKKCCVYHERLSLIVLSAIEDNGDASFLTDSFWRGFEEGVFSGYKIFLKYGNEATLARLLEVSRRCNWDHSSGKWRSLNENIVILRAEMR